MKKFLLLFLLFLVGCVDEPIVEPSYYGFQVISETSVINHDGNKSWISFEFVLISDMKKIVSELTSDVYLYKNKEILQHGRTTLFSKIRPGDMIKIEVHLFEVPSHESYDEWEYQITYKE